MANIEFSDDIIDILGIHIGEEEGKKVALLKVALNPDKSYEQTDPDGLYFHATNGINHQNFGPVAIADSQEALLAVPDTPMSDTAPEISTESSEANAGSTLLSEAGLGQDSGELTPPDGSTESTSTSSKKGKGK